MQVHTLTTFRYLGEKKHKKNKIFISKYDYEGVDKFAMLSLEQIFLDSGTQDMMPLHFSHTQTIFRLSKWVKNIQDMSYKVRMSISLSKEYNDQKVMPMPKSRIHLVIENRVTRLLKHKAKL